MIGRHAYMLLYSVARGELALVKQVLENPEMELHELSHELYKAICLAADNESWDIVLYLLQPEIVKQAKNLYNEYQQIFQRAVESGQLAVINRLLEADCIAKGVNPAFNNNSAIAAAKLSANLAVLERLLEVDCIALGVDPAADKNIDLMFMISHEYGLDLVKRLLQEVRVKDTLTNEQWLQVQKFLDHQSE